MITPQVGDKVWFWPAPPDGIARQGKQPLSATIAAVNSPVSVHLGVLAADGNTFGRTSVPLIQPEQDEPASGAYCEFRPDDMPALAARDGFRASRAAEASAPAATAAPTPATPTAAPAAAPSAESNAAGGESTPNP